jgi:hypothetical protein
MKRFKFSTKFNTKFGDLWKDTRTAISSFVEFKFGGFDHLHDNFNLSFLNDYVRENEFTNMKQKFTRALPLKNFFEAVNRCLFSCIGIFFTPKCIDQPVNQTFIGATYNKVSSVVRNSSFASGIRTTSQSTLTINDSSHVGANRFGVRFTNIFETRFNTLVNVYMNIYNNIIKGQSQRLSERGFNFFKLKQAIV